jgi:hypothetical protein
MSLLPNQTNVSPSTFFFALSGAGPGSTISSFNTLTTSTFTVSTIVNHTGESQIQMDDFQIGLRGISISTSGQFLATASTGISLLSPQGVQLLAGEEGGQGVINLRAPTINIQRVVSSTVTLPTNIVSEGCGILSSFSSLTVSSISGVNAGSIASLAVSSIQANGGPLSFYNMGNIDVASDVDITVRSANIDIPNSVIINAPLSQVEVSSIIGSNTRFVNTANQSSITIAQLISTVLG